MIYGLRAVAARWHTGQWSALYAFASTGTVVPGLYSEAMACARKAQSRRERKLLEMIANLDDAD